MRSRVLLLMLVLAGDIRYSRAWRSVSVSEFGAIGDNKTDNTEAFRAATRAVDGGGEIVVPSGIFQTALELDAVFKREIGKIFSFQR